MTPEELVQIMTKGGPFRIPLTYPTFQAIRAMTPEQAQTVVNSINAMKQDSLVSRKTALETQLAEVQAEIDAAQPIVDGGLI